MILPDDILSLISTYSRPLKRRRVSNYWNNLYIKSDNDMISDVITRIALKLQCHVLFCDSELRLDVSYNDYININVWVIEDDVEYLEWKISFEFYHVLNWKKNDERYHIGISNNWNTPTHYITQLINDNGTIVKII